MNSKERDAVSLGANQSVMSPALIKQVKDSIPSEELSPSGGNSGRTEGRDAG